MQRSLNYGAMPPLRVPLPFLLAAPCFALAAALILMWHGEAVLVSRWTPLTLATTHLLTLGFLTMTIVGALFQLLPVVAGVAIPGARAVAPVAWGSLVAGTVLLAGALGFGMVPEVFHLATGALGLAGLVILTALGVALAGRIVPAARPLVQGVRLAASALGVTLGLGATLAMYLAGAGPVDAPLLTDIHAFWGLAGWVVALTAAVSFQVIPMFQGTATYPRALETWLAPLLFALLFAWSAAALAGSRPWRLVAEAAVGVLLLRYAGTTLLFLRRRRRKPDVGTFYWTLAMCSLVLAVLVQLAPIDADRRALLSGILVIVGFGMSAVNGMLYKIVPFLFWYHLQCDETLPRSRVPSLKTLVDEHQALRQWRWHLVSLGLLVGSPLAPQVLARPAGLFQALALALLLRDLAGAAMVYRRASRPQPEALRA